MIIYKITNPRGKEYIGQTNNIIKRIHNYKYKRCKGQVSLYNSICKYGWENHAIKVMTEFPDEYADDVEIEYIKYHKTYHTEGGMNLTRGGLRPKMTQETKDKLSKAILGSKHYKAKKLYQYDVDNNLIKIWDSMKDIQRTLGYFTSMLSQAAKGSGKAYGYIWSYKPL